MIKERHYRKATFNSPYETDRQQFFLRVSSAELWIYDGRSGRILLKRKL